MTRTQTRMIFALALALAVGGCKKKEPEVAQPDPAPKEAPRDPKAPVLAPVHFETASNTVVATEMPVVEEAAGILKSTDWDVIVVGLSDASGDDDANKVLSQQRADAVAELLRTKSGVAADRVLAHGIGEKLATATTVNERKVEFVFYHDTGLQPRQVVRQSGVLEEDFRAKRRE
jgi:outer membrane protein OmpA-like peptidoglycan-associated protein